MTDFFEDVSQYDEDPDRFLKRAKLFVVGAWNNVAPEEDEIDDEQLYIVWFAYTLGNWKALISTTVPNDGLYFEVTHDDSKNYTYVDTYKKINNQEFRQEEG